MSAPRMGSLAARRRASAAPPGMSLRALRRVGVVSLWLGTLAGLLWGLRALASYARAVAPPGPVQVVWVDPPAWLGQPDWREVQDEAERAALEGLTGDVPRPAQAVSEALARCAWVRRVHSVLVRHDGRVRIHAEFRKPAALVARQDHAWLVDEQGVRLPRDLPLAQVDRGSWLVIVGVRQPPPRHPGQRWPGEDLAAGMRLLRYLHEARALGLAPFWRALTAVDVSHYTPQRGELRLLTNDPRVFVIWGRPPGEEYEIEAGPTRKLDALRTLFVSQGGVLGPAPLDLRDSELILRLARGRGNGDGP